MMKGLLLKEFYVASRTCRSILFVVVVFFALSFFGRDSQFFFLYPLMMVSLLPVTLLTAPCPAPGPSWSAQSISSD